MSEYQLGAYYDIRYVQYFVRYKFLLGLSKYNEDDTILEREKKIKAAEKEYINYPVSDWITQKTESEGKKMDERSPDNCVFHTIGEMSRYLGKTGILDKVVDEYLLSTYIDIDEQEFQVCKCVFWTIHDIGVADYIEVVTRILLHRIHEKRNVTFSNIKEVEETIQRLVHKGILSQNIEYISFPEKNGNRRRMRDEPSIYVLFTEVPREALKAISETFGQVIKSFFVPHTNNAHS